MTSLALGDQENPYETLWRAMFWLGFGLVALTLVVWAAVAFIVYMRWEVPVILQEPRPQFMLLLFGVPAIAQACASESRLLPVHREVQESVKLCQLGMQATSSAGHVLLRLTAFRHGS